MTPFSIIPVLDLKGGLVVHARAGERERYQPLRSRLAIGSGVFAIVDGLLSLARFRRLYIADLDAIEGNGDHRALIADIARRRPDVELWVDAGVATAAQAIALAEHGVVPVLGSESLGDGDVLAAILARLGSEGAVLSLDYRQEKFLGPAVIERNGDLWPARVVVMSLARVGTARGPDMPRLAATKDRAGTRAVFAAGGVRDGGDLERLTTAGYAGALVATALHDGRLTREALADLAPER